MANVAAQSGHYKECMHNSFSVRVACSPMMDCDFTPIELDVALLSALGCNYSRVLGGRGPNKVS